MPRLMDSWERELDIMLKVGDAPIPLAQRLAGAGLQAGVPHKSSGTGAAAAACFLLPALACRRRISGSAAESAERYHQTASLLQRPGSLHNMLGSQLLPVPTQPARAAFTV